MYLHSVDDHSSYCYFSKTTKTEWVGVVVLLKTCIQEMLVQITVRSWDILTDSVVLFLVSSGKFQVSAELNGGCGNVVSIVACNRLAGVAIKFWWGQCFFLVSRPPSHLYCGCRFFFGVKRLDCGVDLQPLASIRLWMCLNSTPHLHSVPCPGLSWGDLLLAFALVRPWLLPVRFFLIHESCYQVCAV
jgi:hypothetical protein